jgi:hypothetical protein
MICFNKVIRGKRNTINYVKKKLQLSGIPRTLWDKFVEASKKLTTKDNEKIHHSKVFPYLLVYFYSLPEEDKRKLIETYHDEVMRQVILSGGDNNNLVKKFLVKEATEGEVEEEELL